MLEFLDEVLEFKYDDKVHQVRFPTGHELSEYSKTYDDSKAYECVVAFLVKLGLDEEVANKLQMKHLMKVLTEITTEKK